MSTDTPTRFHPAVHELAAPPKEPGRRIGALVTGLIGLYLAIFSATRVDPTTMGARGLVTILPLAVFLGLALVLAALLWELRSPQAAPMLLLTAFLVMLLFGIGPLIEPVARLSDSWFHEGIANLVTQTGAPLPPFDARASWPGGFSLAAMAQTLAGTGNVDTILRWAPPVFELAYLAPLRAIARASGVGVKAGWLGTLIFYLGNWTEQDYFSPQALNMFFFLVIVATVLTIWRAAPASPTIRRRQVRRLVAFVRPAHGPSAVFGRHRTTTIMGLLLVIAGASATSHQLTPYALVLALAACLLTRRLPGPELILGVGVLSVGWLSLGAVAFWSDHLNLIFGGLGQLGNSVQANVGNRIVGSVAHQQIVHLRILFTLGVVGLAGVGAGLRIRQPGRHLEALAAAPFLLLGAQSYGGEGLLRIYLFALPFMSLLAGTALERLLPDPGRRALPWRLIGEVATLGVLGVAGLLLVVTRGGNDTYVAFRASERAGILQLDHRLPFGTTIGVIATYLPINDQRLASLSLLASDGSEDQTLGRSTQLLLGGHPDIIILNCSQEDWGEQVQAWPVGWDRGVERAALAAGYVIGSDRTCMTVLRRADAPSLAAAFTGDPR